MSFKFFQHNQTRDPNGKLFGRQTMFDHIWSPDISLLDRALELAKFSRGSRNCQYLSDRPQVSMGYKLINHAGCFEKNL